MEKAISEEKKNTALKWLLTSVGAATLITIFLLVSFTGCDSGRSRVSDVQFTIGAIFNSIKMYRQDFGEDPQSVDQLVELGYLELSKDVLEQWTFRFVGSEPIKKIEAVSTEKGKDGAGHIIAFDIQTGPHSIILDGPSDE